MATNDKLINALIRVFESPNECDSNGEPPNVVDGLYAIARAIRRLANAVELAAAKTSDDE